MTENLEVMPLQSSVQVGSRRYYSNLDGLDGDWANILILSVDSGISTDLPTKRHSGGTEQGRRSQPSCGIRKRRGIR
jgi:hypothetical protein